MRMILLLLATCLAAAPMAVSAATIDFDSSSAPGFFADANGLTTEFEDLGIIFDGGGAILDNRLSSFVTGNSTPNVLVYNDGGFSSMKFSDGSDVSGMGFWTLTGGVDSVEFLAGIGGSEGVPERVGGTLVVNALDSSGQLVAFASLDLQREMQLVTLSGRGITQIELSTVGQPFDLVGEGAFVVDDIRFSAPIIPEPNSIALAIMGSAIVAFAMRRELKT